MSAALLLQAVQLTLEPRIPRSAYFALGFVAGLLGMMGATDVARAKGYSQWLGLLGVLSFVGMAIVSLLPEHAFVAPAVRRALPWPRSAPGAPSEKD